MPKIYSPDELNNFSKETLVAAILSMQDQLSQLNANMERLIEQIADANNKRYGRSTDNTAIYGLWRNRKYYWKPECSS